MSDSQLSTYVQVKVDEHLAVVTLANPAKRNAVTAEMWQAIPQILADLAANPGVRAVVLTGEGEHFSAGSDIRDLDNLHHSHLPEAAEASIVGFAKPVIAAIRGYCLGGGCQLANACDLRIAATDARFGIPPAKLGIVYPLSATRRLVAQIGPAATKYLIFTSEQIDAGRALRIGLVDEVVDGDPLPRARELAAIIAERSLLTVEATKDIVGALTSGENADERAVSWVAEANAGPDLTEGMTAFVERRLPNFTWTGRSQQ